jgi:DNA-binding LytR/AlgR family response regulator
MSECPRSEFHIQTATARPRLPVIASDDSGIVEAKDDSVDSRQHPGTIDKTDVLAFPVIRAAESKRALPQHQEVPGRKTARIAIRSKGRIRFLQPIDLISVHAQGNYVLLELKTCSRLLRGSISTMAGKLEPYGFIRIHRSVLINSAHVEEVLSLPTGEYGLRVQAGRTYRVGRRYAKNLPFLAELWLGADL